MSEDEVWWVNQSVIGFSSLSEHLTIYDYVHLSKTVIIILSLLLSIALFKIN